MDTRSLEAFRHRVDLFNRCYWLLLERGYLMPYCNIIKGECPAANNALKCANTKCIADQRKDVKEDEE